MMPKVTKPKLTSTSTTKPMPKSILPSSMTKTMSKPNSIASTTKKTLETKPTSTANTTTTKTFLKRSTEPKLAHVNAAFKNKKRSLLESTSFYMWEDILIFCVDSIDSLVSLAKVCKLFYKAIFERAKIMRFVLMKYYQKELKENPAVMETLEEKKYDLDLIIEFIKGCEMVKDKKKVQYFVENYLKIFQYGHVKENILNKLIEKLQLRIDISWNRKRPYYALYQENFPYKMKYNNNMSHILLRVDDIKKILINDLSVLDLQIKIKSRYLRRSIELDYLIKKDDLYSDNRKSTKVFHYFPIKNLLFVYFDKDTKVQYMLCDISILEVVTQLYNKTKNKISKAPKVKRVITPIGISLVEYVRQQMDFEIHFCIKNHAQPKFYFINTTSYPKDLQEENASFRIPVDNSFSLKGAEFKLDDELGINQIIKDFFLVDFILKDKDNILIAYSGFMDVKELNTAEIQKYIVNYMNYSEECYTQMVFEYSSQHYSFKVTCTRDTSRNEILVHEIFIDIKKSILENI